MARRATHECPRQEEGETRKSARGTFGPFYQNKERVKEAASSGPADLCLTLGPELSTQFPLTLVKVEKMSRVSFQPSWRGMVREKGVRDDLRVATYQCLPYYSGSLN